MIQLLPLLLLVGLAAEIERKLEKPESKISFILKGVGALTILGLILYGLIRLVVWLQSHISWA